MQAHLREIRARDAEVVAISVDPPERSRELAAAHAIEFPILSDPQLEAIDAFGVRHVGGGLEGDIARPAVFVVDRSGAVAWRELTENWRVRVRPATILAVLERLP